MDDQIDYLWKQKVLLNLFGVFPATPCVTNRVRIGRAVYSKCVLLLLMHMFALFGITAVKDCMYNSLAEIMYSALQTLLLFHMTFIASYYQYFADEIFDLLSFANRIARQRSAPGLTFVNIDSVLVLIDRCLYFFTITVEVAVLQYLIHPVLSADRVLILRCWYPFDALQSPYFEVIFFVQTVVQLVVGLAFSLNFIILLSVSLMACCQLNLLCCSIKNVLYTALATSECAEHRKKFRNTVVDMHTFRTEFTYCVEFVDSFDVQDNIVEDFKRSSDETLQKTALSRLNDCVIHMQQIYIIADKIENLFHPILLVKIMVALMQIGFTLSNILWIEHSSVETVNDLQYLLYLLMDVFALNYCGQVFINQSSEISNCMYSINWYEMSVVFQTQCQMFMLFTTNPIRLRAGKFFETSYELFVVMMRMSFSFFTLLSQANEE